MSSSSYIVLSTFVASPRATICSAGGVPVASRNVGDGVGERIFSWRGSRSIGDGELNGNSACAGSGLGERWLTSRSTAASSEPAGDGAGLSQSGDAVCSTHAFTGGGGVIGRGG